MTLLPTSANSARLSPRITGLGAISPVGLSAPDYVAGLRAGQSGVRLLDPETLHTPAGAAPLQTRVAAQPWGFAPESVLESADLRRVPRLIPMALAAALEALAHAGLTDLDTEASRNVGLILGTGGGGIDFTLEQASRLHHQQSPSLWTITNATHGNLAGELSIRLGLRGPSYCVSDGCASASNAIALADAMLRAPRPGSPTSWVVIGADAHVRDETLRGMELLKVIHTKALTSPDEAARASRPFDRNRSGFVLGEGAWAAVVETPAAVEARGADALGTLLGIGSTCDAYHRVRPDPDMTECVRAMELALADAGLQPEQIRTVQYHGTSTEINDRQETHAVRMAFGAHAEHLRGSSIKGAIGHPQGACGLASLVAMLGAARGLDGAAPFLPPTLHLENPDPACDLDYTPNHARELTPEPGGDAMLLNCLAFGAKNTALVVRSS